MNRTITYYHDATATECPRDEDLVSPPVQSIQQAVDSPEHDAQSLPRRYSNSGWACASLVADSTPLDVIVGHYPPDLPLRVKNLQFALILRLVQERRHYNNLRLKHQANALLAPVCLAKDCATLDKHHRYNHERSNNSPQVYGLINHAQANQWHKNALQEQAAGEMK